VGDELVAGAAQLVGVPIAGEIEGARDRLAVDAGGRCRGGGPGGAVAALAVPLARRGVKLLDDGEEVPQELLVRYGCLCPLRNRLAS
jgi:hypothetical protein